jgi:hypothetical protein
MLTAVKQTKDWHRYVLAGLYTLSAICTAVATDALKLPPALETLAPWAAFGAFALATLLPRIQTSTGPGADPVISPAPKNMRDYAVPLVPAFKVPGGVIPPPPPSTMILVDGHELPRG